MNESVRRVAVIGNSHIGAITNGWKLVGSEYPGVSLTFFGAIAGELAELRVQRRSLVPESDRVRKSLRKTSGGAGRIAVDDFDEFLVVALEFSIYRMTQIFRAHRFVGLEGAGQGEFLVSRAAFRQALRDALEDSVAVQTVRKLRQIAPEKRIVLMPQAHPRMPANVVVDGSTVGRGISVADAVILKALYDGECRAIAAAECVELQQQGDETVCNVIWTDSRFGVQPLNVNGGEVRKEKDYEHMNAEYGAHALRIFAAGK